MKAFTPRWKTVPAGWPHPSLSRRSGPARAGPDEHSHADVLTFGFQTSLPPSRLRLAEPVALEVCNPLQWRNRPRISRGSQRWLQMDGKAIHQLSKSFLLITPPLPPGNNFRFCKSFESLATWLRTHPIGDLVWRGDSVGERPTEATGKSEQQQAGPLSGLVAPIL